MKFLRELFNDYEHLIKNDTTDYIHKVAQLVPTTSPTLFESTFKEWLINSVANVFNEDRNTNPRCLIICGGQGTYKTHFVSLLFPNHSTHADSINSKSKDNLLTLTDSFLTILDGQYLGQNKQKEVVELKKVVSMHKVRVRQTYARTIQMHPRLTNFIATTNLKSTEIAKQHFLAPFDLKGSIDLETICKIDLRKMWGQAYQLYKQSLNN